jgi:hypothetical protein
MCVCRVGPHVSGILHSTRPAGPFLNFFWFVFLINYTPGTPSIGFQSSSCASIPSSCRQLRPSVSFSFLSGMRVSRWMHQGQQAAHNLLTTKVHKQKNDSENEKNRRNCECVRFFLLSRSVVEELELACWSQGTITRSAKKTAEKQSLQHDSLLASSPFTLPLQTKITFFGIRHLA